LLYDAGPAFSADADSGERVIAPYLRAAGIERLDAMIVTHDDNDHAGGAASVLENFEVGELLSSLPAEHPLQGLAPWSRRCAAGRAWEWDGVRFELLHPEGGVLRAKRGNDLSCVLKVTAGGRSMLLTGDIEKAAETELLQRSREKLASDVLLVPHHGSRTSSTADFLAAVGASVAVIPVGYRNRFGHPNAGVLERLHAQVYRTDGDGAVGAYLSRKGVEIHTQRRENRRYWHDAPP
ncbi:MAG: ComEC/Rec2 family competence protein, partial [Burkholderiales bacterium]